MAQYKAAGMASMYTTRTRVLNTGRWLIQWRWRGIRREYGSQKMCQAVPTRQPAERRTSACERVSWCMSRSGLTSSPVMQPATKATPYAVGCPPNNTIIEPPIPAVTVVAKAWNFPEGMC